MQFILDKYAKVTFRIGSWIKSKNIILDINTEPTELEPNKTYGYLWINEVNDIHHTIN